LPPVATRLPYRVLHAADCQIWVTPPLGQALKTLSLPDAHPLLSGPRHRGQSALTVTLATVRTIRIVTASFLPLILRLLFLKKLPARRSLPGEGGTPETLNTSSLLDRRFSFYKYRRYYDRLPAGVLAIKLFQYARRQRFAMLNRIHFHTRKRL
jgi:hypothetical protein